MIVLVLLSPVLMWGLFIFLLMLTQCNVTRILGCNVEVWIERGTDGNTKEKTNLAQSQETKTDSDRTNLQ